MLKNITSVNIYYPSFESDNKNILSKLKECLTHVLVMFLSSPNLYLLLVTEEVACSMVYL